MAEEEKSIKKFRKELNSGTVSLMLLAVMAKSDEPLYGYQIMKRLEEQGRSLTSMKQGTLYPVLRSLAASGLLSSSVEPSVSGPPRKYYAITPLGRETLSAWREIWTETSGIVEAILAGGEHEPH